MLKSGAWKELTPFKHRIFVAIYVLLVVFSTYQWNRAAGEVQDCEFESIKGDLYLNSIEQFRRDMEILRSIREVNSPEARSKDLVDLQAKIDKNFESLKESENRMRQNFSKIDFICSEIDDASWNLLVVSLLTGGVLTALSMFQPKQQLPKRLLRRKKALRKRLERVNRR